MIVAVSVLIWCAAFLGPPGLALWFTERPNRRRTTARAVASLRGGLIVSAGFFTAYIVIDLAVLHSYPMAIGHTLDLCAIAWFNYRRVTAWAPLRAERRTRDNHERLP